MSGAARWTAGRSLGAIFFDLVIIGFTGLIVINALGIRPGAALVPLIVGIPTLIVALIILMLDLFPALRRATGAEDGSGSLGLSALRAAEEDDELEVPADPKERRNQIAFAAWVFGFVILMALTNIYIAITVGLTAIYLAIRLPILQIVLIVGVTVIGFYALLYYLLGLRL